jgi:hypothetical protein
LADRRSEPKQLRRVDRELSDPDSLWLEHDHSPAFDTRSYLGEIGEQEFELCIRMPRRRPTKQNHRGPLRISQRKQRSKVGVCRNDHTLIAFRALENHRVVSRRQPEIPHVDRIVASLPQPIRHDRRKGIVDPKSHDA